MSSPFSVARLTSAAMSTKVVAPGSEQVKEIVLVEANIGWIPTVMEQLDDMFLRYRWFSRAVEWMHDLPSRVFWRSFWSTFMVDTVGIELRHRMNMDNIMWSTDYPHTGSDWPNHRVTIETLRR